MAGDVAVVKGNFKTLGITVRGGLFLPSNANAIAVSKSWTAFGADLKLSTFAINSLSSNGFYSVSADYIDKSGWRSIPATVNVNIVDGPFTYFAGAGVALTHNPTDVERYVPTAAVGATLSLAPRISVTGKYNVTTRTAYNGFGFYVGVKL